MGCFLHLLLLVLLEGSHEGGLVGRGLEASVAKLGGGVDELKRDLLGEPLGGQGGQGLPERFEEICTRQKIQRNYFKIRVTI